MKRTVVAALLAGVTGCSSGSVQIMVQPTPSPSRPVVELPTVKTTSNRATVKPSPSRASRSRSHTFNGEDVTLDVTMYCWTGNRTASGAWPAAGQAAGNRWTFGTQIQVPGYGLVTITDRIGWGSDLDLYGGRAGCEDRASNFGRRHLTVTVMR